MQLQELQVPEAVLRMFSEVRWRPHADRVRTRPHLRMLVAVVLLCCVSVWVGVLVDVCVCVGGWVGGWGVSRRKVFLWAPSFPKPWHRSWV